MKKLRDGSSCRKNLKIYVTDKYHQLKLKNYENETHYPSSAICLCLTDSRRTGTADVGNRPEESRQQCQTS